jgi:hypothetical protein
MAASTSGIKLRVNITIDRRLHRLAVRRAKKELKLEDGFSGYLARLIILDIKRRRKRVAFVPSNLEAVEAATN